MRTNEPASHSAMTIGLRLDVSLYMADLVASGYLTGIDRTQHICLAYRCAC